MNSCTICRITVCALQVQASVPLHACLAATISADVWGVRRELLPWLQYHTELGAARFYVSCGALEVIGSAATASAL